MKCDVERGIESIPQTVESKAWLIVILDSLDSGKFLFFDLIHKFLRTLTLVCYLLNLVIKEGSFGDLDNFFECIPGF